MALEKRSLAVSEEHKALVEMAGPDAKFGPRTAAGITILGGVVLLVA